MGNTFGNLFRLTTFGESHGKYIGCIIDGCPSNIKIDFESVNSPSKGNFDIILKSIK